MGKDLEVILRDGTELDPTDIPLPEALAWSPPDEKMTITEVKMEVLDLLDYEDVIYWNIAGYLLLLCSGAFAHFSYANCREKFLDSDQSPEHPGDDFDDFKTFIQQEVGYSTKTAFYDHVQEKMREKIPDWDGDVEAEVNVPHLLEIFTTMSQAYNAAEKAFIEEEERSEAVEVTYWDGDLKVNFSSTVPQCSRHGPYCYNDEKMTKTQVKNDVRHILEREDDIGDHWNFAGYLVLLTYKVFTKVSHPAWRYQFKMNNMVLYPGSGFASFQYRLCLDQAQEPLEDDGQNVKVHLQQETRQVNEIKEVQQVEQVTKENKKAKTVYSEENKIATIDTTQHKSATTQIKTQKNTLYSEVQKQMPPSWNGNLQDPQLPIVYNEMLNAYQREEDAFVKEKESQYWVIVDYD